VAKPELGAKRQCQACAAKFFDLNRDPIVCPKCGTVFQGAPRVERAAAKDEESEDEQASAAGVEMVSLDEAAAEEKSAEVAVDDIDVEDDESADDAFLEQEEEDEDDVSSLIDGEIASDEEP
jgi:uncharacterized protein (TIGR02300 family)